MKYLNLDGVFEICGILKDEPVLLVDDVVDSRWTLTIVGLLLKRAGAGAVYPVALATSEGGLYFRMVWDILI